MANILNIETSTSVCSVALGSDGQVLDHHENYDGQTHATLLSQFIKDALDMAISALEKQEQEKEQQKI